MISSILKYFSKESKQERSDLKVQQHWDNKTDSEIINAYKDNMIWKSNYDFLKMPEDFSGRVTNKKRFEKWIKPQMDKRGLWRCHGGESD